MSFSGPEIKWPQGQGIESLRSLVENIDLGPALDLRVVVEDDWDLGAIYVGSWVRDRAGGPHEVRVVTTVVFSVEHMLRVQDPRRWFIERVRRTAHEFAMHEIDEWFKVDGERVYDPHR